MNEKERKHPLLLDIWPIGRHTKLERDTNILWKFPSINEMSITSNTKILRELAHIFFQYILKGVDIYKTRNAYIGHHYVHSSTSFIIPHILA